MAVIQFLNSDHRHYLLRVEGYLIVFLRRVEDEIVLSYNSDILQLRPIRLLETHGVDPVRAAVLSSHCDFDTAAFAHYLHIGIFAALHHSQFGQLLHQRHFCLERIFGLLRVKPIHRHSVNLYA